MSTIIVGGNNGTLARSIDGGGTWESLPTLFSGGTVQCLTGESNGVWIAGGLNGALVRSTDNGDSWGAVTSGLSTGDSFVQIATDGAGRWVAVALYDVLLSDDDGATWSRVDGAATPLRGVATNGAGVWIVAGGPTNQMRRSTDGGVTWATVAFGASRTSVAIATNKEGLWVATTVNSAIYRTFTSTDDGATWSESSSSTGFNNGYVVGIAFGTNWIGVGYSDIRFSPDLTGSSSLITKPAGSGFSFNKVCADDGFFVLPSTSGRVLLSDTAGSSFTSTVVLSTGTTVTAAGIAAEGVLVDPEDPIDSKVWLAAGYAGGVPELHRSTDNGVTWVERNIDGWSGHVNALATDDLGRWMAVCNDGGMYRSTDNGRNWIAVDHGLGSGDLLGISSGAWGVWIATGTAGSIYRSLDHGQTWAAVSHGIATVSAAYLYAVESDRDGTWIVVTGNSRILRSADNGATWSDYYHGYTGGAWRQVATDRAGVWVVSGDHNKELRSADSGATWETKDTPLSDLAENQCRAMTTDRAGVWVSAWDGAYIGRSTDNRASLADFTQLSIFYGDFLAMDTDADGVWIVASSAGLLFRSTDNGASWPSATMPAGASYFRKLAYGEFAEVLPIDPPPGSGDGTDPSLEPLVWIAAGANGTVSRSTNNGVTWVAVDALLDDEDVFAACADAEGRIIIGGELGQVRRSTDFGVTWSVVDAGFGDSSIRGIAASWSGVWVVVADGGKIRRSVDNGVTWSAVSTVFDETWSFESVATDGNGVWVVVGRFGDMIRSTNNGLNWSEVDSGFAGDDIRSVATDRGGIWVATGFAGKIRRSTTNGVTWAAPSGAGVLFLRSVAANDGGSWVAVGALGEIMLGADNGATWAASSGSVGGAWMNAVAASPSAWVAGGDAATLYRSDDGGVSWYGVISGLGGEYANAVAFAPNGAVRVASFDVSFTIGAIAGALVDWSALITQETVDGYTAQLIDPDGVGEPLNLRISSWQGTIQSGRASYLQCVVPAADELLDSLIERAGWILSVSRFAKIGGVDFVSEMARAPLGQIQYNKGPSRATVTLSGYATETSFQDFGARTLTGIRQVSSGSGMRVRANIDWVLRPGMTAVANGVPMVARYINYYVSTGESYMDVGDRPGG